MDLSSPNSTTNTDITPVFGDNVQDLLGVGALHVNPSAIITVNSIADGVDDLESGVTTLRDAINQANADTGEDLIVFDRSLFSTAQTITLSQGELDITHNLDIIAPKDELTGEDLLTVSGNKASRVFEIEKEATVTVSGLMIVDGQVKDDSGGGIKNSGTLILDSSIVSNNSDQISDTSNLSLSRERMGGGIYNLGTLTLDSSIVSNNSVLNPALNSPVLGGGIYNTGTLEVNNSTLSSNSAANGGGIYNQGTLTVSNSTLSSNLAGARNTANGGGIYNTGTTKVLNSTITDNSARANGSAGGGGILNAGHLTVSTSTLNNNNVGSNNGSSGGGIANTNTGTLEISNSTLSGNSAGLYGGGISNGGTMTVSNSTISGNSAAIGGGISNGSTMTVSNSTISGNSASGKNQLFDFSKVGGGIYNDGTLTLMFSTLTLNSAANGAGVYNEPGLVIGGFVVFPVSGTTNVRHTIIAGNINSTDGVNPDVSGTFSSNGYNLIGDSTGSTGFGSPGDIVGTSDNPIDPKLASLDFNGGPTQTIALLPDSPAIDAGDRTILDTDPITDQRGLPRVSGVGSDIGAFEFSPV